MRYLLLALMLTGCASIPPDQHTEVFEREYPGATNLHLNGDVVEGYVGDDKVTAHIRQDGSVDELYRRPIVPAVEEIDAAEIAGMADIATTAYAVYELGMTEANPITAPGTIVGKYFVNQASENDIAQNCKATKTVASTFWGGAAGWNIGIIAAGSTGVAIPLALAAGALGYYMYDGEGCHWLGMPVATSSVSAQEWLELYE